jgi:hypothetical protein
MRRGFTSSTLTRCALFSVVGSLYITLFPDDLGTASAQISFAVVVFNLILVLAMTKMPSSALMKMCALSCATEGVCAVFAGAILNVEDEDARSAIAKQFFIWGGQIACLKLSYAIPKISLLRLPYLVIVIACMLVAEVVSLLALLESSDSGGPGVALVLIFSASYNFVAVINSRQFEKSERRLYCLLQNEKIRNAHMAEQIERTNKLGRTVLAMVDAGDESSSDGGEMASQAPNEMGDADLVGEFAFWARLAEKSSQDASKMPNHEELRKSVPEMATLESAMEVTSFKKGFRYFCNEESNIENLMFYEQVEVYKSEVKRKARKMCRAFVEVGAPSQVNINSKQREAVLAAVNPVDLDEAERGNVSSAVFDAAQKEVMKVMNSDTFPRFCKSTVGMALMYAKQNEEFASIIDKGLKRG